MIEFTKENLNKAEEILRKLNGMSIPAAVEMLDWCKSCLLKVTVDASEGSGFIRDAMSKQIIHDEESEEWFALHRKYPYRTYGPNGVHWGDSVEGSFGYDEENASDKSK